jgi:hypothetical protein
MKRNAAGGLVTKPSRLEREEIEGVFGRREPGIAAPRA